MPAADPLAILPTTVGARRADRLRERAASQVFASELPLVFFVELSEKAIG